jgi:outer membrane lipoprotein carrier protein
MRRFLHLIIAVAAAVSLWGASAFAAEVKDVVTVLEKGYQQLSDLQADFAQRTTIAAMKREERGNGELFLKRPSGGVAMFRFNYTKPRQQIVSNGKTLWYYIPDNKQVMVGSMASMFEGGNGIALSYLTGMGNVSRDFSVAFSGSGRDKQGNYLLELVPRKKSQVMSKLLLTISAKAVEQYQKTGQIETPFPILASVVHDQMGNQTRIEFSKIKVNRGLGSEKFTFKVPSGVEVIKN